jgi:hypothetical protein
MLTLPKTFSNTTHQIAQTHFQGCGNSHKGINGDIFLATLNVADVIAMKIGFLSQLFLTPFEIPAMRSYVFAQDFSMFRDFHNPLKEPETARMDYRICTVFCSCILSASLRLLRSNEYADRISAQTRP